LPVVVILQRDDMVHELGIDLNPATSMRHLGEPEMSPDCEWVQTTSLFASIPPSTCTVATAGYRR
jgi:hypothetical protein